MPSFKAIVPQPLAHYTINASGAVDTAEELAACIAGVDCAVPMWPVHTPPNWKPSWGEPMLESGDELSCRSASARFEVPRTPLRKARDRVVNAALSPLRSSKGLLNKVLNQLLPNDGSSLQSSRPSSEAEASEIESVITKKRDSKDCAQDAKTVEAEVVAFRNYLSKSFGNLTRAFRAMKTAAADQDLEKKGISHRTSSGDDKSLSEGRLSYMEFEWVIISYLHYGDRRLARRIFGALDRDRSGTVGLYELARPPPKSQGLVSLVELRHRLLERHSSLGNVFREFEEFLASKRSGHLRKGGLNRALKIDEFVEATSFFGLEAHQAAYFFGIMDSDSNGDLTLDEFMEALTHMPRKILLQDFRERLLSKHASIHCAFRHITTGGASRQTSVGLDKAGFVSALSRLSIPEIEAVELFRIVDEDHSGTVSITELRDALREVAPRTTVEGFWQRLAAEWPDIACGASGKASGSRRQTEALIAELLPEHLRQACHPLCEIGSSAAHGAPPGMLPYASFDAIVSLLDVSSENARELFQYVLVAADPWKKRMPSTPTGSQELDPGRCNKNKSLSDVVEDVIYVDDFLELLKLWTENPLSHRPREDVSCQSRNSHWNDVNRVVGPAKATLSVLKAELVPAGAKLLPAKPKQKEVRASRASIAPMKGPPAPWRTMR